MSTDHQQFHFIVENHLSDSAPLNGREPEAKPAFTASPSHRRGAGGRVMAEPGAENLPAPHQQNPQVPALAVPREPAWLVSQPGDAPRLTRVKPAGTAAAFRVEVVLQRAQPRLLLVCPRERRVRVNGVIAPPFVVLKEKDCIQVEADVVLHVTIFNRPAIGPVSANLIGKECQVCRVPFTANILTYACAVRRGLAL